MTIPKPIYDEARQVAKKAVKAGELAKDTCFFVQQDTAPDKQPIYSLWYKMWGNDSGLVAVLGGKIL